MAQDLLNRIKWWKEPLYWQGSIRGLTPWEKRSLRRRNAKSAGLWALNTIYNWVTDLPTRLAKIPAAAIDQIAWTDIQWTMNNIQSAPSQALRDSASNTKAFDTWEKVWEWLMWIAALLWAWRMWWSNVRTTSKPNPNSILDNAVRNAWYKQAAIENTSIPKYVEMTNNPKPTAWGVKKIKTTLWDIAKELWFKDLSQAKASAKQWWFNNVKEMFNDIIESNREAMSEYEETWPKADAIERWLYEFADAERSVANTSRARANKLRNSNRSRAERTLLKKTERDAEQAVNDVNNLSLEKMYNQWKALNKQ